MPQDIAGGGRSRGYMQQIATKIEKTGDTPQTAGAASAPRTWLLASPHAGDNTQLTALAEALGWPFTVKRLAYKPLHTVSRLVLGATLARLDRQKSDAI